jgi:hypothetical protein
MGSTIECLEFPNETHAVYWVYASSRSIVTSSIFPVNLDCILSLLEDWRAQPPEDGNSMGVKKTGIAMSKGAFLRLLSEAGGH